MMPLTKTMARVLPVSPLPVEILNIRDVALPKGISIERKLVPVFRKAGGMGLLRMKKDDFRFLEKLYMEMPSLAADRELPPSLRPVAGCWALAGICADTMALPTIQAVAGFRARVAPVLALACQDGQKAVDSMSKWWSPNLKKVFCAIAGCLALDGHVGLDRFVAFALYDIGLSRTKGVLPLEKRIARHPAHSVRILGKSGIREESAILAALQHHERLGGGGYPFGHARISAVGAMAGVIDSLGGMIAPEKPGKIPLPVDTAILRLEKDAGYDRKSVAKITKIVLGEK